MSTPLRAAAVIVLAVIAFAAAFGVRHSGSSTTVTTTPIPALPATVATPVTDVSVPAVTMPVTLPTLRHKPRPVVVHVVHTVTSSPGARPTVAPPPTVVTPTPTVTPAPVAPSAPSGGGSSHSGGGTVIVG
jgi:hypothetical protein